MNERGFLPALLLEPPFSYIAGAFVAFLLLIITFVFFRSFFVGTILALIGLLIIFYVAPRVEKRDLAYIGAILFILFGLAVLVLQPFSIFDSQSYKCGTPDETAFNTNTFVWDQNSDYVLSGVTLVGGSPLNDQKPILVKIFDASNTLVFSQDFSGLPQFAQAGTFDVNFSTPVSLTQGMTYKISVLAPTMTPADIARGEGRCPITIVYNLTSRQNAGLAFELITTKKTVSVIPAITQPAPSEVSIDFFAGLQAWFSRLLREFGFTIAGGDTAKVGTPYTANISLTSPEVSTDYRTGTEKDVVAGTAVVDSQGNYVFKAPSQKLTTPNYSYTLNWTPTQTGDYYVISIIAQTSNTYNISTGTWVGWTNPVILASDKKKVTVTEINAPPQSGINFDLFGGISSLWNNIFSWVTGFFKG